MPAAGGEAHRPAYRRADPALRARMLLRWPRAFGIHPLSPDSAGVSDLLTEEEQKIRDAALAFARLHKRERCRQLTDTSTYLPEENPVSVFMAGSAGAGKTETAKAMIAELESHPDFQDGSRVLRIDPDDMRCEFPGYTGKNSYLFQAATSVWVEKMHDLALEQRQSFILDGTLSNYAKAKLNVQRSLKKGRQAVIIYVYQSPYLAWEFVQAREAEEGRRIPAEVFIEQYFAARDVVNRLKKEFGPNIRVDLLLKPNDQAGKLAQIGVDQIDTHVPERFTRAELEAALRVQN